MFVYEATLIGILGATLGMILSLIMGYFIHIMIGNTKYFFTYESLIHLPMPWLSVLSSVSCPVYTLPGGESDGPDRASGQNNKNP